MKLEDIQFINTQQEFHFFGEDVSYRLTCWDMPKQGGWWCVLYRRGRQYIVMEHYDDVQKAVADAQEIVHAHYLREGQL